MAITHAQTAEVSIKSYTHPELSKSVKEILVDELLRRAHGSQLQEVVWMEDKPFRVITEGEMVYKQECPMEEATMVFIGCEVTHA